MIKYFKKIILLIICFSLVIPNQVLAFWDDGSDKAFQKILGTNTYRFNEKNPNGRKLANRYSQYTVWKEVMYGDSKHGKFKTFLPVHFDDSNMGASGNYTVLKNMEENQRNRYGQGGLHLVNSSDWNVKYGWDLPFGINENNYDEKGGNITLPNGKKGELRYIGYDIFGEPINNPYFPDDRSSNTDAWNKVWLPFKYPGSLREHIPSQINQKYPDEAREILTEFFRDHEVGQKIINSPKYVGKKGLDGKSYSQAFKIDPSGEKVLTDEAFDYWNNRFRIEQRKDDLNIMITGNWKRDDGHVLYQTFALPKKVKSSTFIKDYKLTAAESEDPLAKAIIYVGSVGKEYGDAPRSTIIQKSFFSPMGKSAEPVKDEVPTFTLGGQYSAVGEIVHAKVNPATGKDTKVGEPTKTQPQKIHFQYQYYDEISKKWYTVGPDNTFNDAFWEGKEVETPLVSNREKSSKVQVNIKWPHDINSPTKRYSWGRVLIKIPSVYKTNQDDYILEDNEAFLEFKIAGGNDMGMKEPVILKNPQGTPVEGPEVGNDHTLEFIVENITEQEIKDPNTTIDITVVDKNNNDAPIYQETIEAGKVTGPQEQVVIVTPPITIPSNKIEACAIINPLHKEKGQNLIEANDTICKEFGSNQDMEMGSNVSLISQSGQKVSSLGPGESHSLEFVVKHIKGAVPVGTANNSPANPNATIDVEVKDDKNNVIFEKTFTSSQILQPSGNVVISTGTVIKTNSPTITACAVINKVHDEKGFNIRTQKDQVCETFGSNKNLSVKQLKVTPNIVETQNGETVNKQITFDYEVAYDTTGTDQIDTELTFKANGQTMFVEPLKISPGQKIKGSKTGTVSIPSSGVRFELVINNTRKHKEFLEDGSDPYKDNSKTASVTSRKIPECVDCDKSSEVGKGNKWKETITWNKIVGDKNTYYGPFKLTDQDGQQRSCDGKCTCSSGCYSYCSGHTVSVSCSSSCPENCSGGHTTTEYRGDDCSTHHENHYCSGHRICVKGDWKERLVTYSKDQDYSEEYKISKVYYKSKWSKDKFGGDGWIEVKQGDTVKIKSGYAFDIKVETHYKTSRKPDNVPKPSPEFLAEKGECKVVIKDPYYTAKERDPGVPTVVYAKFTSEAVAEDCYKLIGANSKNWWDQKITHVLESRDNKAGTDKVTGIYVSEKAKPNQIIKVNLTTPIWNGYSPSNVVSVQGGKFKKLQDCFSFNIEILANNDLNTGIIQ